jgi:hypothetical protein
MPTERWTVTAELRGEFTISHFYNDSKVDLISGLVSMDLQPKEVDGKAAPDHFVITLVIDLPPPTAGVSPGESIIEVADNAMSILLARMTFGCGRPVSMVGDIYCDRDNGNGNHTAILPCTAVELIPPSPLPPRIMVAEAPEYLERAMHWWSAAASMKASVDRLSALSVVLDTLASKLEGVPPGDPRVCENCKHEKLVEAGTGRKAVHLMHVLHGLDLVTARAIYESRIFLAHGTHLIDQELRRRFSKHASILRPLLRKEIVNRLEQENSPRVPAG